VGAVAVFTLGGLFLIWYLLGGGGGADGCQAADGSGPTRQVTSTEALARQWQQRWEGLPALILSGQTPEIAFDESEVSSRANQFLREKDAPVKDVLICFHAGSAEATAKADIPVASDLPIIGGVFEARVRVAGAADLSGPHPYIELQEVDAGRLPGAATDALRDRLQDEINSRLDDLTLDYPYTVTFTEGRVTLTATIPAR
jgi:hypothetical protein